MKYLLATAAYTNPSLLNKCITSWPEIKNVDKFVFIDKSKEQIAIEKVVVDLDIPGLVTDEHCGCGGSWNAILDYAFNTEAKYDAVIIVGSDTEMSEGFLKGFIEEFESGGYDFAITKGFDWNCWVMSKPGYELIGEFDTLFYPCYHEDNDYHRRVYLSGIKYGVIGDTSLFKHYGSATIKLSDAARKANDTTFMMNKKFYIEKWGGEPGSEIYRFPFNDPEMKLNETTHDKDTYEFKRKLWANC